MIEHELILQLFGQDASIDLLTRLLRELKAEKNSLSPLSVADIIVDAVECWRMHRRGNRSCNRDCEIKGKTQGKKVQEG